MLGLTGILYLLFEKSILASTGNEEHSSTSIDHLSRGILGVQIGLIILAMAVTKSSVASIQTKQGLPFGNQFIGWAILGEKYRGNFLHGDFSS